VGFFFILILDNLYALPMTFGIGGAHDVGFERLHGGDLTTIEGEEFTADDGQFSL
jgi:hypothetical protein